MSSGCLSVRGQCTSHLCLPGMELPSALTIASATFGFHGFPSRLVIDLLEVPGLLYSPDSSSFESDVFYPNLPSFVCPIYKSYCGTDRLDFWTRWDKYVVQKLFQMAPVIVIVVVVIVVVAAASAAAASSSSSSSCQDTPHPSIPTYPNSQWSVNGRTASVLTAQSLFLCFLQYCTTLTLKTTPEVCCTLKPA